MKIFNNISKDFKVNKEVKIFNNISKDFKVNKELYFMIIPVISYYLLFCYFPMYGAMIAFQDYSPIKGIFSDFVGLKHFEAFFKDPYFTRIMFNTLKIGVSTLIIGFPVPIILALMLNEVKIKSAKSIFQTATYLPYFISLVVICGIIKNFTMDTGIVNYILSMFGFKPVTMLTKPELFLPIYLVSDIWRFAGWQSIIYLAALSTIDLSLYEAAKIDGANKIHQLFYITLPSISLTIVTLLILKIGTVLSVGFEKIILLYNPSIYSTADVISTYVYRKGLLDLNWSYSSAVGLFNSVICLVLLISANYISKKVTDNGLI